MKINHIILSVLAVALAGTTYYGQTKRAELTAEIAELHTTIGTLEAVQNKDRDGVAALRDSMGAGDRRLSERIDNVSRYTEETIAAELFELRQDELVGLLLQKIDADPAITQRLKGERGPAATAEQVAAALMVLDDGFASLVADRIWVDRREELSLDQSIIATVAEAVFSAYNEELRGPAGASPSAEAVAQALAAHQGFSSLLISVLSEPR